MARKGINKVMVLGNLGQDPETRYMPNGNAVTTVSIATGETWKDKQSGQTQERTEWHRVVFFNKLAEISAEYLRKGSKVYVEGSLRTNKWQDQSGNDRYTTEIIANEMQMLDSRGDNQQGAMSVHKQTPGYSSPNQQAVPQYSPPRPDTKQSTPPKYSNSPHQESSSSPASSEFDDDIPF